MTTPVAGRLVILSGPSGVGKSPLDRALGRFYPALRQRLQKLVLYNSRKPRPGELDGVDYHFRQRPQIEALQVDPCYALLEVRGDLQALDLTVLAAWLKQGDVFFEGNPFVGRLLQTHPALAQVQRLSVFLSPLSKDELLFLKAPAQNLSLPDLTTEVMRRKLLRRTRRQQGELSLSDLDNLERRAASAFGELQQAAHFDWVVPNHDGEDSENWEAFYYPIGDARRALLAFVDLLEGRIPAGAEQWPADLLT